MFKLNKKFLLAVVVLNIIVLTIVGCSKDNEKVEGAVAIVNGQEISREEFDRDFNMFRNMYAQQLGEEALTQEVEEGKTFEELLEENILEKLIVQRILTEDIEELGIEVSEKEVEAQLEMNIESLGGEEAFKEFLEENDFTEELYRETMTQEMSYQKHEEEFMKETKIPEEEKKEYFEENKDNLVEVKVSHILVETEDEGKEVIDKLDSGEEFESLAASESIDSNTAENGGDLGYFNKDSQLDPNFMSTAFNLEVGEFSKLVETDSGYHVILLKDKKDNYEDFKDNIDIVLKNNKYVEKIETLKNDSDIEILMEKDEEK